MNLWSLFLSVLSFLVFFSGNENSSVCLINNEKIKKTNCSRSIDQGIKGKVILQKGNFMPSPGAKPKQGIGVKREIGFFELTREDQTIKGKGAGFYNKIKTKRILRVYSDKEGCFIASLKPGKYSMLVKEEGQWYANSFGPNNEIFEVEVKDGEVSVVEFKISHKAAF